MLPQFVASVTELCAVSEHDSATGSSFTYELSGQMMHSKASVLYIPSPRAAQERQCVAAVTV